MPSKANVEEEEWESVGEVVGFITREENMRKNENFFLGSRIYYEEREYEEDCEWMGD